MTRNAALITARKRAGLSQDGLASLIQEVGHKLGRPNECNRANIHRWENGTQPQPFYVLLLESALGMPAASLGFAYAEYGMDRDEMLADAGLDVMVPIPEPSARYGYGPLTGVWLSHYEYHSSSRDATFASEHYVMILQRGAHLNIRSLPKQSSRLSLTLSVNGRMTKGTWTEHTSEGGYYHGSVYDGTIQLEINQTGDRMKGRWLGFGRDPGEINDGPWQFTRVDEKVDRETLVKWDRSPGASLPR
jgi:transcriptional regulator with XRE-family HTH domain